MAGKALFRKDKRSRGNSLEDMTLGPLVSSTRVVRDLGVNATSSLSKIAAGWVDRFGSVGRVADSVGARCVKLSLVGISVRVPEFGGPDKQIMCPRSPEDRCGSCVVDAAFKDGFPMNELGGFFAKGCGKNPEASE